MKSTVSLPRFVRGDIDGFFGLVVDNLIQFLVIMGLCIGVLGFSPDLLTRAVLPGAALSVFVGNIFYSWQARRLAAESGRDDVTALPYGINTVSLFAFVFLIMLPVRLSALDAGMSSEAAAEAAWQIGLVACFLSGCIELLGAPVADLIRRYTPRAALLSTLAGIAISFIAIDFAIRTFATPLVAMLPLGIILFTYFARMRLPFGLPGGLWAVLVGSALAWILFAAGDPSSPVSGEALQDATGSLGFYLPIPVFGDLIEGFKHPLLSQFLVPVILPMGLFNLLGSLQNLESAEAAGDKYPSAPSLLMNGLGSTVAAVFGSCFPTTIYIGHPGWKAMGARSGYSTLNGVFFLVVALCGAVGVLGAILPIEAGMAIVLWIGVTITAQAFQAVPRSHAPAVAVGLFPAIAGWGVMIIGLTLGAAQFATGDFTLPGTVLSSPESFEAAGLSLKGLVALSQGFLFTCIIWSSASVHLIERETHKAAVWMGLGAVLSFFGFMHAGALTAAGSVYELGVGVGWKWALGYALCGVFFWVGGVVSQPMADRGRAHDDIVKAEPDPSTAA